MKHHQGNVFFNNLIWLNTNEAAEYLRVSPGHLRVLVCRGAIKAYKFTKRRNRFKRIELDRMIESSFKRR
jgi:excisionase family DNA binding protein